MLSQKSKWIIFTLAVACVGCCAVPLYLIIAGIFSVGMLAALINPQNMDALICFAPLALIAVYLMYKKHQAKRACCAAPAGECSSTQCNSKK